jgi:hypothetical protein
VQSIVMSHVTPESEVLHADSLVGESKATEPLVCPGVDGEMGDEILVG